MEIVAEVKSHFGEIKDPRKRYNSPHKLLEIIIIALCGVICGANNWVSVEEFGRSKEEWLREELGLRLANGIPSHDTFGRVFELLEPQEFGESFIKWVQSISQKVSGVVSIDGKRIRRSYDKWTGKEAIHMISAWADEGGLVLGQCKTEEKSNEIRAIPALLKMLLLKGCIVTIDAMGCQTKIVKEIVDKEADYVIALKRNQGQLYNDVKDTFEEALKVDFVGLEFDFDETIEKGHGRIEIRRCWTISDPELIAYINPQDKWVTLNCIVMIEAERRIGSKVSKERRYYISSLLGLTKELNRVVRTHWRIENKLHWILDVVFREDDSRVRRGYGSQNFATLRHIALNLLRREKTFSGGIHTKRLKAAWNTDYLLRILFNLT